MNRHERYWYMKDAQIHFTHGALDSMLATSVSNEITWSIILGFEGPAFSISSRCLSRLA